MNLRKDHSHLVGEYKGFCAYRSLADRSCLSEKGGLTHCWSHTGGDIACVSSIALNYKFESNPFSEEFVGPRSEEERSEMRDKM